jgi:endonuclease YncB( thermonuclease family)
MRAWLGIAMGASAIAAVSMAAADVAGKPRRQVDGPVKARLVRVVDGDTIDVLARIWPDHYVEARVRLAGIDAPELRGKCAAERARAAAAKARLAALLAGGNLELRDIRYGKYAGRVVARVLTESGRDAGALMIAARLARPYAGGHRAGWCGAP